MRSCSAPNPDCPATSCAPDVAKIGRSRSGLAPVSDVSSPWATSPCTTALLPAISSPTMATDRRSGPLRIAWSERNLAVATDHGRRRPVFELRDEVGADLVQELLGGLARPALGHAPALLAALAQVAHVLARDGDLDPLDAVAQRGKQAEVLVAGQLAGGGGLLHFGAHARGEVVVGAHVDGRAQRQHVNPARRAVGRDDAWHRDRLGDPSTGGKVGAREHDGELDERRRFGVDELGKDERGGPSRGTS